MRDAISLISKEITINNTIYRIDNFFFVPEFNDLYISLYDNINKQWKNYPYSKLLPYIIEQIR